MSDIIAEFNIANLPEPKNRIVEVDSRNENFDTVIVFKKFIPVDCPCLEIALEIFSRGTKVLYKYTPPSSLRSRRPTGYTEKKIFHYDEIDGGKIEKIVDVVHTIARFYRGKEAFDRVLEIRFDSSRLSNLSKA